MGRVAGCCGCGRRAKIREPLAGTRKRGPGKSFSAAARRSGEGGGLCGLGEDLPHFLHARDGFGAGAKAQAQLAAEAAHAPRQVHRQQAVLLQACGAFFRREAQPLDGAGQIVGQKRQLEPGGVDGKMLTRQMPAVSSTLRRALTAKPMRPPAPERGRDAGASPASRSRGRPSRRENSAR